MWSCAYRKNCEDISARNFPLLSRVTKKLCWLYSSVTIVTRLRIFFMWKRLISSKAAIKAQAASELTSSYDGHDTIYGATWWNLLGSITWPFLEGGTLLRTRHSWWWQSQQTGEIIGLLTTETRKSLFSKLVEWLFCERSEQNLLVKEIHKKGNVLIWTI